MPIVASGSAPSYAVPAVINIADLRLLAAGAFPVVMLEGISAAGDGGGGHFYWAQSSVAADDSSLVVAPSSGVTGRWLRLNTSALGVTVTQSGTAPISRTVSAKLQERISVEDYGADPTGVADSTVAFQNATSRLAALGGGILVLRNGGSYKAWGANTNDLVAPTSGTRGIAIEGNGSLITSSLVNDSVGVFLASLNNIGWFHVEGVKLVGGNTTLTFTTGEGLVDAWNGTKNISIEGCSITNARQAMRIRHASGSISGTRVRGIHVNGLDCDRVYYPINFQFNGDDVFVRGFRSINGGRCYFAYNVRNHDIQVYSEQGGALSDCLLKLYAANLLTAEENTLGNIRLDYQTGGRYTGSGDQSNGQALIEFSIEQLTGTTAAGTMRDIDVHVEAIALSAAKPSRLVTFTRYKDDTPTGDGTSRSHIVKNITISGSAKDWNNAGSDGIYLFSSETLNAVAQNWSGDTISGIRVRDFDMRGDPSGEAIYINGQGFSNNEQSVSLENVRIDGDITEISVTSGMLSYKNVKANNKNALSQKLKSYTVTWTADGGVNPAIGNGTLTGDYFKSDLMAWVRIKMTAGGGTTFGTGTWSFSLPFTCNSALQDSVHGEAVILDSSASLLYTGIARAGTGAATVEVLIEGGKANYAGSAVNPGTAWATGDSVSITVAFPVA